MFDTMLDWIIGEIESKSTDPVFLINKEIRCREYVEEWAEKVQRQCKWIKYKQVNDNVFELKDFFPDPPFEVCSEMVNSKVIEAKERFECKELYFKISDVIYNEAEGMEHMLAAIKSGIFCIDILRPNIEKSPYRMDRYVSEIEFSEGDIEKQIKLGFLSFKIE